MQSHHRPHQTPSSLRQAVEKPPQPKLITRRDFLLALLGMGTAVGAVGGLGLGYLLLDSDGSSAASLPTPTPNRERMALLKTVDRPIIVSREEWGAREVNHEAEQEQGYYSLQNPEGWRDYEEDLRLIYNTIVIHHSVLYADDDLSSVVAVQNLHMNSRKWADIGYHFCVGKNGTVFEGRKLTARGTHTEARNTGTLGICLLGNFQDTSPTDAQLEAAQRMVNWLAVRLDVTHLAGHRDFNDTTVCPGNNLYASLDAIAINAMLKRGTDGYVVPPEQLLTPTLDPSDTVFVQGCSCGCCAI